MYETVSSTFVFLRLKQYIHIPVILIIYAFPSWIHAAGLFDEMSAPASIHSASKSALENSNGVDRLSSLPDELLHHVMSFLPMPEVHESSLSQVAQSLGLYTIRPY
jgi:hypothetical protein